MQVLCVCGFRIASSSQPLTFFGPPWSVVCMADQAGPDATALAIAMHVCSVAWGLEGDPDFFYSLENCSGSNRERNATDDFLLSYSQTVSLLLSSPCKTV